MSNLTVSAELQDKMSGPLKVLTDLWGEFAAGVAEGAKAELEAAKATNKLTDEQDKLDKSTKENTKSQGGLAESLKTVGKALAGLAVAQQIFQAFAGAVQAADALDDLAEKTGIAASSLAQYKFFADQSGSSLDGFVGALNKLNRSIGKSEEESSKQARAFEILGISAEGANGKLKSSEELFAELQNAFSGLKDGPEKSALAFAIFGDKARELGPILNMTAEEAKALREEAQALGQLSPTMLDNYAASSGKLFDGLNKLGTMFTGLVNVIAAEVVPIFNLLIESFVDSFTSGGLVAQIFEAIKAVAIGAFIPAFKAVVIVLRGAVDALELFGKGLAAVAAAAALVAQGDLKGAKQVFVEFQKDVEETARKNVEFRDKLLAVDGTAGKVSETVTTKTTPSIKGLGGAAKSTTSELEKMTAAMEDNIAKLSMSEAAYRRFEINRKAAEESRKPGANLAKIEADRLKALDTLDRELMSQALKRANDENDAIKAQIKLETDLRNIRDEALKRFPADSAARKDYIERETAALQARNKVAAATKSGGIPTQLSNEAQDAVRRQVLLEQALSHEEHVAKVLEDATRKSAEDRAKITEDIVNKSYDSVLADVRGKLQIAAQLLEEGKISVDDWLRYTETQTARLSEFNKEAADEITLFWQEAAKGMQAAMGDFFFDLMQGEITNLGDRFKKMLDRMVADALAANLAEALFGKGFSKSGNIGGWIGSALGWLGGARAVGGNVNAGTPYMVGENGPEIFRPSMSGNIIPTNRLMAGGSTSGIVNFNITAMDSQDVMRALEKNKRQISEMVIGTTRTYNLG